MCIEYSQRVNKLNRSDSEGTEGTKPWGHGGTSLPRASPLRTQGRDSHQKNQKAGELNSISFTSFQNRAYGDDSQTLLSTHVWDSNPLKFFVYTNRIAGPSLLKMRTIKIDWGVDVETSGLPSVPQAAWKLPVRIMSSCWRWWWILRLEICLYLPVVLVLLITGLSLVVHWLSGRPWSLLVIKEQRACVWPGWR